MTERCPTCLAPLSRSAKPDSRAAMWRMRVRLYPDARPGDPAADSDPELPVDAPGAGVVAGLPGVAEELAALATAFHKGAVTGLEEATLRHSLRSLRPTLHRRGGNAAWRVPYQVAGAGWLARVDVERVES